MAWFEVAITIAAIGQYTQTKCFPIFMTTISSEYILTRASDHGASFTPGYSPDWAGTCDVISNNTFVQEDMSSKYLDCHEMISAL